MIEGLAGIIIGVLISLGFDPSLPSWSIGPSGTLILIALLDELSATAVDRERKTVLSLAYKAIFIVAALRLDSIVEAPIAQFAMLVFLIRAVGRFEAKFRSVEGVK